MKTQKLSVTFKLMELSQSPQQTRITSIRIEIFVIALMATAIGVFLGTYYLLHLQQNTQQKTFLTNGQVTPTTAPKPSLGKETVSTIVSSYPYQIRVSLDVPIEWRTTEEINAPMRYDTYGDTILRFLAISQDPMRYWRGFRPENQLAFYDVTSWLEHDYWSKGVPTPRPGPKAADKKVYFNYLINLRKSQDVSNLTGCKEIFIDVICSSGSPQSGLALTYIESSDKIFSGFAKVKTSNQAFQYDPTVYIYMAGVLDGHTIYIEGNFLLHDQLSKQIDASATGKGTKEALDLLQKRGLPQDTQAQYDQVLEVIRSIKVESVK